MRKKIVVLGGASGIGKAISMRFAQEGWQVLVASSNQGKVNAMKTILPEGHYVCIPADVRNETDLERLTKTVSEEFGEIDVLINSIGVSRKVAALESEFEEWDDLLQVMLYGVVKVTRKLAPFIKNGGRIINITSIHHNRVAAGSSSYGMAKAAITQFTRSLAVELAHRNILANTIAPGFINTPMSVKEDGKNELDSDWFYENYIKHDHLPLKRAGNPEEVAGVAWFLAGADASYMTGSVLTVDGGLTITF